MWWVVLAHPECCDELTIVESADRPDDRRYMDGPFDSRAAAVEALAEFNPL